VQSTSDKHNGIIKTKFSTPFSASVSEAVTCAGNGSSLQLHYNKTFFKKLVLFLKLKTLLVLGTSYAIAKLAPVWGH